MRLIVLLGLTGLLFGCAVKRREIAPLPPPAPPKPDPMKQAILHYEKGLELLRSEKISLAKGEFENSLRFLLKVDATTSTRDSLFTEVCRARILADRQKITRWRLFTLLDGEFVFNKDVQRWIEYYTMRDREYMEKALDEYSYQTYQIQPTLHIWGRRYAPWLKYTYDVYRPLLKEMKKRIKKKKRLNK